jgi:hypothetical protein
MCDQDVILQSQIKPSISTELQIDDDKKDQQPNNNKTTSSTQQSTNIISQQQQQQQQPATAAEDTSTTTMMVNMFQVNNNTGMISPTPCRSVESTNITQQDCQDILLEWYNSSPVPPASQQKSSQNQLNPLETILNTQKQVMRELLNTTRLQTEQGTTMREQQQAQQVKYLLVSIFFIH